ncbi:YggS family pyridoxal phosphate-dependent enzyme [Arenimonas sp.]|uniref:YggS family pyridoxal phosphate-dependent enzyme n=1 Tax=Arenimonas sp. TaxID=1872635 RepID=UPI0039E6F67C
MNPPRQAYSRVLQTLNNAASDAGRPPPALLAVSKTQPPEAVAALARLGQRAFGENYVQEGVAKILSLADAGLEWHLIGHLQSNKAREAAEHFDWVQTVDRPKLVEALDRHRPPARGPLNVLLQVNIDDEASKSGCAAEDVPTLAELVAQAPRLRLRGLMSIGAPHPDFERRRATFRRMRELFDDLRQRHPEADTLSMGMSEDFALAIAEGATMVRVGSALFGPRTSR